MSSELTIGELRARGQVVEHSTVGNVLFPGVSKLCPSCGKVYVGSKRDLDLHLRVCEGSNSLGWRKSDYRVGEEWCFASKDPALALAIRQQGPVTMNGYTVKLSADGKYLLRRRSDGV